MVVLRKMKLGGFLLLVGCVAVLVVSEETSDVKMTAAEKTCEPGKELTKDCGVCKCNAEGTEYICPKECTQNEQVSQTATGPENEKCIPGEVFKRGCNECKCPESGMKSQAACTIIGCPDE